MVHNFGRRRIKNRIIFVVCASAQKMDACAKDTERIYKKRSHIPHKTECIKTRIPVAYRGKAFHPPLFIKLHRTTTSTTT